ncbi:Ankyrin-3 [Colletotrichum spinosum]|uniref:Ankyrin-3 n=1 Tax=Colletotrichum spinosum TaxID=1347390 RepID=A0A4R8QBH1_9PEZI|nr:Ankyrin-3 [Colletotrichum spinosum]
MERGAGVTASPDGAAPPVFLAIEANDLDWVSKMSETKGYRHTTTHGSQPETMLQFACRKHGEQHGTDPDMDIVDGLLRDGADINASNGEGEPPLIVAVKARKKAVTARLLKQGADPNAADSRGAVPLHFTRNDEVIPLLSDFGADPNAAAAGGVTTLMVAALDHNLVTAQKLVGIGRRRQRPSTQRLQHPVDKTVISAAMKSVSAGDAAMKMVMAQLEVLSPEHEKYRTRSAEPHVLMRISFETVRTLHLWRSLGGIAVLSVARGDMNERAFDGNCGTRRDSTANWATHWQPITAKLDGSDALDDVFFDVGLVDRVPGRWSAESEGLSGGSSVQRVSPGPPARFRVWDCD